MNDLEHVVDVKEVAPEGPDPLGSNNHVVLTVAPPESLTPLPKAPPLNGIPRTAVPPGSSLARPVPPPQHRSGINRAVDMIRVALPYVHRMLPLLDGNIGTAVSNVLAPPQPKAPPEPPVNLVPLQEGLADLRIQQRALRDQVVEQNSSLKRVEDHLQAVREATDRNTLEQQELLEDLKSVGSKVNVFAYLALALLGVSVILNAVLYLQIRHIIP